MQNHRGESCWDCHHQNYQKFKKLLVVNVLKLFHAPLRK